MADADTAPSITHDVHIKQHSVRHARMCNAADPPFRMDRILSQVSLQYGLELGTTSMYQYHMWDCTLLVKLSVELQNIFRKM